MKSLVWGCTPQKLANTTTPSPFFSGRPIVTSTPSDVISRKEKFTSLGDASKVQPRQTAQHPPATCCVEQGSEHGHMYRCYASHPHTMPTPHLQPQAQAPLTCPQTHTRHTYTQHTAYHTHDTTNTPYTLATHTYTTHMAYTLHTSHYMCTIHRHLDIQIHTTHRHHTHRY